MTREKTIERFACFLAGFWGQAAGTGDDLRDALYGSNSANRSVAVFEALGRGNDGAPVDWAPVGLAERIMDELGLWDEQTVRASVRRGIAMQALGLRRVPTEDQIEAIDTVREWNSEWSSGFDLRHDGAPHVVAKPKKAGK
jgi:hypothetical protein